MYFTKKRLSLYLVALMVLQIFTFSSGVRTLFAQAHGYFDLRAFYTAGYMLRTGHSSVLYDYAQEQHFQNAVVSVEPRALPMMSPPFTALPFALLSHLSFSHAWVVFAIANILFLLASVRIVKPFLSALSARWSTAPTLLFLSFLPMAVALVCGQISILLLLIYCASFVFLRRGQDLVAGLILSFALMKFQVAVPIALLFVIWRQWRFITGFLAGTAILLAVSIRMLGLSALGAYLGSLYTMTHSVVGSYTQLKFAILPHEMPNLYGMLFVALHGAAWSHLLIITISLAVLAWAAFQRPSFPLALLTGMLVSYHLFFYDLTLLLLPLSLLADHLLRNPETAAAESHKHRLLITQISVGILLLAPFLRFLMASDETCWLALPVLGIVFCSDWWPELHGLPEVATANSPELVRHSPAFTG